MVKKRSLTGRIITAFFMMTLVVGGVFSVGLVVVVHLIEKQFVTRDLNENLNHYLLAGIDNHQKYVMPTGMFLYKLQDRDPKMPDEFEELDVGYHEVVDDNKAWYVLVREVEGQKIILAKDQDRTESREQRLYMVVFAGYLASLLLAAGLGWLVSKRVIRPVTKLAKLVHGSIHNQNQPHEGLAPEFANDEVGQLAHAFDEAMSALYQILQRERLFTSDVSHELRTPLMIISSSSELIKETSQLNPQQQKHLQKIMNANQEMQAIVDTFLLLARSEQQQDEVKGRISLMAAAIEQVAYMQSEADRKGLKLELIMRGISDSLYADAYLRAVISNLLRNALNYTNAGHVSLIIDNDTFWVEDSGQGIPEHDQASIFNAFKRGSNTTGEGLGLGLSLVERICKHQRWSVKISALKPNGTKFEVNLKPD